MAKRAQTSKPRRTVPAPAQPQARSRFDLERDASEAFRRLSAFAALLEASCESDTPIEPEEFWAIGDMIRQETKRAETAFDELVELAPKGGHHV